MSMKNFEAQLGWKSQMSQNGKIQEVLNFLEIVFKTHECKKENYNEFKDKKLLCKSLDPKFEVEFKKKKLNVKRKKNIMNSKLKSCFMKII